MTALINSFGGLLSALSKVVGYQAEVISEAATRLYFSPSLAVCLSAVDSGAVHTCDGFAACFTLLGVQVTEALQAVGAVFPRGEGLASQLGLAASADEALFVPRLVTVGHSTLG